MLESLERTEISSNHSQQALLVGFSTIEHNTHARFLFYFLVTSQPCIISGLPLRALPPLPPAPLVAFLLGAPVDSHTSGSAVLELASYNCSH